MPCDHYHQLAVGFAYAAAMSHGASVWY